VDFHRISPAGVDAVVAAGVEKIPISLTRSIVVVAADSGNAAAPDSAADVAAATSLSR
jgi:hypothetical protein